MSTIQVAISIISAFLIVPTALYSLVTRSNTPTQGRIAKYYRAEKNLDIGGNLVLLVVGLGAMIKLADHFGIISHQLGESAKLVFGVTALITVLGYIGLWISAVVKVRAGNRTTRTAG